MNTIQIPTSYYDYNHSLPFSWQDVLRLEGQRNYTVFVLNNGQKYTSTKSIGNYEPHLPSCFIRVSKGCIVKPEAIQEVAFRSKTLSFTDGFSVKVARRRWAEVRNHIGFHSE
jgi:DNA-binding LytR/AlgR family response regulator